MAGLHGKKRMFVCVLLAGLFVLIAVWSIVYACTVDTVSLYVSDESSEDAETHESTSVIIPVGEQAHFYAECDYDYNPNNDGIEWTFDLDGDVNGTYETTDTTPYDSEREYLTYPPEGSTFDMVYSNAGEYTISIKARLDDGEDTWEGPATCDVTVVGVLKVVKEGTDDDEMIYVCLNETVDLEAIPDTGSTFPDGEPTWEITSRPAPENPGDPPPGSVSSTGETPEQAELSGLTVPGDYVVEATCGTSSDSIEIKAVGVGSITVAGAESGGENSYFVCGETSGVVTITAYPDPSVSVGDLPDCWMFTSLGTLSVTPIDRTTIEVDATVGGLGQFTWSAGTSQKTVLLEIRGHPNNIRITGSGPLGLDPGSGDDLTVTHYGMIVYYAWGSTTGDLNDLRGVVG